MGTVVVGLIAAALLVWVLRPTRRRSTEAAAAFAVHDAPSRLLAWAVSGLLLLGLGGLVGVWWKGKSE